MSDVKRIATRESYGKALVELGKLHENLVVLDNIEFGDEFYGIAVQKGNADLLASINATIERINSDGTMDALLLKYFPVTEEAAEEEETAAE